MDAFGVVAGDDEDLRGSVDADAELFEQVRGALQDELLDLRLEFLDLVVQSDPTFRDRPERVPVRVLGRRQPAGSESGTVPGDHLLRFLGGLSAEVLGGVDEHRLEHHHRPGAVLHRGIVRNLQLPDHLDDPVSGLRNRGHEPGENCSCGVLRVQRVRLAVQAPQPPIGAGDLDHLVPVPANERGQASAIGTGALDPERDDLPERRRPLRQLPEPGGVGRDRQGREDPADRVHHRGNVNVLVSIDADHDVPRAGGLDLFHGVLSFTG